MQVRRVALRTATASMFLVTTMPVSSYRDDLEAAQARADAAEREAAALKRKLAGLEHQRAAEGLTIPIPERFTV